MEHIIAFCGLACHECHAYIATRNNDDKKRAETAQLWSKEYNADIKPEDINCDGCQSDSNRLFNHCRKCEIRKCGKEKEVSNCALCDEYVCDKLEKFLGIVPECRPLLQKIRGNGVPG